MPWGSGGESFEVFYCFIGVFIQEANTENRESKEKKQDSFNNACSPKNNNRLSKVFLYLWILPTVL